jgi:hypothetical protein
VSGDVQLGALADVPCRATRHNARERGEAVHDLLHSGPATASADGNGDCPLMANPLRFVVAFRAA